MPWIPLLESDLRTAISGSELDGLRSAALADGQPDPVDPTIARVVARVRGDVAASGKYDLDADTSLIPDRLLDASLSLIVMRFMSRPAAAIIDDDNHTRQKLADSGEALLKRVAEGNFAIEDPDTGEETTDSAVSLVTYTDRHFTKAKMNGL